MKLLEIKTIKNESVVINLDKILFITTEKNNCVVVDETGNEFTTKESYDSLMHRIAEFLIKVK